MPLNLVKLFVLSLAYTTTLISAQSVRLFGDTKWALDWSLALRVPHASVRINMPWFNLHNRDFSPTGSFANNRSMIVFYTNESGTGSFRVGATAEKNFPTNFALDGVDNQIPPPMVRKTSTEVIGIAASP